MNTIFRNYERAGLELVTVPKEKLFLVWNKPFQAQLNAPHYPGKDTFLDAADEEKIMFMRTMEGLFDQARAEFRDTMKARNLRGERTLVFGMESEFNYIRREVFRSLFEIGDDDQHEAFQVHGENKALFQELEMMRIEIFFKLLKAEYQKEGKDYLKKEQTPEEQEALQTLKEYERRALFYIGCVFHGLEFSDEVWMDAQFRDQLTKAIHMYENMMELFYGEHFHPLYFPDDSPYAYPIQDNPRASLRERVEGKLRRDRRFDLIEKISV